MSHCLKDIQQMAFKQIFSTCHLCEPTVHLSVFIWSYSKIDFHLSQRVQEWCRSVYKMCVDRVCSARALNVATPDGVKRRQHAAFILQDASAAVAHWTDSCEVTCLLWDVGVFCTVTRVSCCIRLKGALVEYVKIKSSTYKSKTR